MFYQKFVNQGGKVYQLTKDLSNLIDIEEDTLVRLVEISNALISQYIVEAQQNNKDFVEIDIGCGIIYIQIYNNILKVKFKLNNNIVSNTNLDKKEGYLETLVSRSLTRKLQKLYEELS